MWCTKYAIEEVVLQKVMQFWDKSCIPTKHPKNQNNTLSNLVSGYLNLKKSGGPKYGVEEFRTKLAKHFDMATSDVVELILMDKLRNREDKEQDLAFLSNQRGLRLSTIASFDMNYTKNVES